MSDRIRIRGISADAVVGVFDWERRVRQSIRIDLELHCSLAEAAATDRLEHTVDYKAVTTAVRERVETSRYRLVEALAEDVAEACLAEPRVHAVAVTVRKPGALRHAEDVSVTIERRRDDASRRAPHRALIGVGSNIDPVRNVRAALTNLHEEFGAIRVSPAYRTEAVSASGATGAPWFVNLAVEVRTGLEPEPLQEMLHGIEDLHGRVRTEDPDAPRTLDLDLLLYDDIVHEGRHPLPHRLLASAPFVLVPAADICPSSVHPLEGCSLAVLRARLPTDVPGVEPLDDVVY